MGIVAEPPVKPTALHERDFHAWTEQQAALLRARKIARAELAEYKEFPDLPATCPFDLATVRDETFSPIGPQTKTN